MRIKFMVAILSAWLVLPVSAVAQPEEPRTVEIRIEVLIQTEMGDITLALYPERAPGTVANFMAYVDGGYYTGGAFYRVVRHDNDNGSPKITVIQGGANLAEGEEPFPPVKLERTNETGISHMDGVISMARGEPDSATHAIFIVIGNNQALDYGESRNPDLQGFAAFGIVTSGMDVVRAINALTLTREDEDAYVAGQILVVPVIILNVRRIERE